MNKSRCSSTKFACRPQTIEQDHPVGLGYVVTAPGHAKAGQHHRAVAAPEPLLERFRALPYRDFSMEDQVVDAPPVQFPAQ